jgi:glycosyltransferase involved in cell wall biosynthesis
MMDYKTNKNIALLIITLGSGGTEQVCVNLANLLSDRGWEVELLIVKKISNEISSNLNQMITPVYFTEKKLSIRDVINLFRYIKLRKIKRILVFSYSLSIYLLLFNLLSFKKVAIFSRSETTLSNYSIVGHNTTLDKLLILLGRFIYKRSELIIAQCNGMETDLVNNFKISHSKIVTINNPIKKSIYEYILHSDIKTETSENYILCVGHLEPVKAYHFAIKAFVKLSDDHPKLLLKIVGTGSCLGYLQKLVSDLGVTDKVVFEGFQPNVIPYYIDAKAVILTSLTEGYPNVIIESIALGTPVVSFDCPNGPADIIQDGINGFLVKYCDEIHLEKCIRQTLDRGWDKKLVSSTVKNLYPDTIIEQYERILT